MAFAFVFAEDVGGGDGRIVRLSFSICLVVVFEFVFVDVDDDDDGVGFVSLDGGIEFDRVLLLLRVLMAILVYPYSINPLLVLLNS